MITYYLIGNWMGPFRTNSSTESLQNFLDWARKYEFEPHEDGIWRSKTGGRIVFESVDESVSEKIKPFKIGI